MSTVLRQSSRMRNRLREARKAAGITQTALAGLARITKQTIVTVERDDGYAPNGTVMLKIADALDCTIADLFWSESESSVA